MGGKNSKAQATYTGTNPVAVFTVTGGVSGTFKAELFMDRTPRTASSFIDLVRVYVFFFFLLLLFVVVVVVYFFLLARGSFLDSSVMYFNFFFLTYLSSV